MRNFFILGHPRSRTAWLSTFMTYDNCFCFHEAYVHAEGIDNLANLFQCFPPFDYIGTADSGLAFYADQLLREFPNARYVVIDRPVQECAISLDRAYPEMIATAWPISGLAKIKARPETMIVNFHELDIHKCLEIHAFCTWREPHHPDYAFLKRLEDLDRFNIQIIPEKETAWVKRKLKL